MDAVACGVPLSAREEELLGLLAGFPDADYYGSDRELSFSDIVEAGATSRLTSGAGDDHATPPAPREDVGRRSKLSPSSKPQATVSKQQREQVTARDKRQRRQRSGSGSGRGSCGGGDDGVLLNLYVPGLLTRSMTAPRPGRGALPQPGQGASPAKASAVTGAAGKARVQAPLLGIGCWPALWGRGRDRRRTAAAAAKACS